MRIYPHIIFLNYPFVWVDMSNYYRIRIIHVYGYIETQCYDLYQKNFIAEVVYIFIAFSCRYNLSLQQMFILVIKLQTNILLRENN